MSFLNTLSRHYIVAIMTLLWSTCSVAGVSLTSTRLIVADNNRGQEASGSIGVRSDETSSGPYLVKAQIFRDIKGQQAQVPFVLSPALFRLEPGDTNQLRVVKKSGELPKDRESLFYLRVAALPASGGTPQTEFSAPKGALNVATGNIIKLFYRPNGLQITAKAAPGQLQFTAAGNHIKVNNPTPYYITLSSLQVNGKPVSIRTRPEQNMIAPFGETLFSNALTKGYVQWQAIDDYGGRESFHGAIR
ncbi:molecular chaperone [Escherichia coli]|uniref:fimbrial biogenesis chaperone n=1 Tax=Escherichia coli TaxID=562 RepID=UPI0038B630A2